MGAGDHGDIFQRGRDVTAADQPAVRLLIGSAGGQSRTGICGILRRNAGEGAAEEGHVVGLKVQRVFKAAGLHRQAAALYRQCLTGDLAGAGAVTDGEAAGALLQRHGSRQGQGVALQRQHGSYAVQREGIGRQRDIGQHDHRRETGAVLVGIGGGQRILQMREEGVVPPGLCLKAAVTAQAGIVKAVTGVPLEVNGGAVAGLVGDGQGLLSLLRAGDGAEAEDIPAVLGGVGHFRAVEGDALEMVIPEGDAETVLAVNLVLGHIGGDLRGGGVHRQVIGAEVGDIARPVGDLGIDDAGLIVRQGHGLAGIGPELVGKIAHLVGGIALIRHQILHRHGVELGVIAGVVNAVIGSLDGEPGAGGEEQAEGDGVQEVLPPVVFIDDDLAGGRAQVLEGSAVGDAAQGANRQRKVAVRHLAVVGAGIAAATVARPSAADVVGVGHHLHLAAERIGAGEAVEGGLGTQIHRRAVGVSQRIALLQNGQKGGGVGLRLVDGVGQAVVEGASGDGDVGRLRRSRGVGAGDPAGELAAFDGETGAVGGIDGGAGVAVGGRGPDGGDIGQRHMGVGAQKGQGLGLAAVAGAEVLQRAVFDAELAAGDGDDALLIVGGLARYGVVVEVQREPTAGDGHHRVVDQRLAVVDEICQQPQGAALMLLRLGGGEGFAGGGIALGDGTVRQQHSLVYPLAALGTQAGIIAGAVEAGGGGQGQGRRAVLPVLLVGEGVAIGEGAGLGIVGGGGGDLRQEAAVCQSGGVKGHVPAGDVETQGLGGVLGIGHGEGRAGAEDPHTVAAVIVGDTGSGVDGAAAELGLGLVGDYDEGRQCPGTGVRGVAGGGPEGAAAHGQLIASVEAVGAVVQFPVRAVGGADQLTAGDLGGAGAVKAVGVKLAAPGLVRRVGTAGDALQLAAFHNETLELDAHISGAGAGHAALTEDIAVGESEAAVASDALGIALDGGAAVAQHLGVLSGHGEPADGIEADALIGAVDLSAGGGDGGAVLDDDLLAGEHALTAVLVTLAAHGRQLSAVQFQRMDGAVIHVQAVAVVAQGVACGGGHLAQSHGPGVAPATALLVEVQTIAGIAGAGGELGLHGAAVGGEAAPEADAAAVVGGGKVRTGGPEDAVIQRDVGADGCALGALVGLEHGTAVGVVILHRQRAGDEHIQRGAAPAPAIDRQAAAAAQLHLAAAVYGGSAAAGEGAGGTVGQIDGGPVGQDQRMGAVVADRQGQAREGQGLGALCPRPAVAGGILRDGGQVHGSGHRRRLLSQDLHRQHG